MSMKVTRTSSTTTSSAKSGSKTSNSTSSSSNKSSSKTSSSKSSSSSKCSSKTSSSKSSTATKSSSKTSSSKSLTSTKSSSKTSSSKSPTSTKSNSNTTTSSKSTIKKSSSKPISATKTSSNKMLGLSAVSSASKMEGKIASNSNSTNSTVHSNINRVISGVKYITDAPIIYTKQALKSTVVSSATALAKNPSKDYVPGMPPSVYEKYKKSLEPKFNGKTPAINKMLDNLDKDTSLKLSDDKKAAILVAGEKLLNEGYEAEFVAGVLGNIMNEGEAGKFESSNYSSEPKSKPDYLIYMDNHFNYGENFSGQNISEVGIKETIKLQKKVEATTYYMDCQHFFIQFLFGHFR
ncbi:hypothetical protein SAMN05661086_03060 [Anaeromicropila populeti]|uniref:Uncharacterized protein n=2 Tax=Anaeromicropila populeti TaxID=37658 RepID=A0A1I6L4K4_9FIRM|nr:hypothetical protein SAMN05661086_03060 [Anaeromicropila populeti]